MSETSYDQNFLTMYSQSAGNIEAHQNFIYWSGVSLLGAALGRNVYMTPIAWQKLFPNLYVYIIGPSGSGKGNALNLASTYASKARACQANIHPFKGTMTFAALYDEMEPDQPGEISKPVYILAPELSDFLGKGEFAKQMLKTLTNLYEGHSDMSFKKKTRTHGTQALIEPVINFLGASDVKWLRKSIDSDDVEGGAIGRTLCVFEESYVQNRVPEPDQSGYTAYHDVVITLLWQYSQNYRGLMLFDEEAQAYYNYWYREREHMEKELMPTWQRLPATVRKLAMIHRIAEMRHWMNPVEDTSWKIIPKWAVHRAIIDAQKLIPATRRFILGVSIADTNPIFQRIIDYVRERRVGVWETEVYKRFARYGRKQVDEYLSIMEQEGNVRRYERSRIASKSGTAMWVKYIGD